MDGRNDEFIDEAFGYVPFDTRDAPSAAPGKVDDSKYVAATDSSSLVYLSHAPIYSSKGGRNLQRELQSYNMAYSIIICLTMRSDYTNNRYHDVPSIFDI